MERYLLVKAIRDIASGLFTAILILNQSAQLLGWFMLIATVIPLTDMSSVLRHVQRLRLCMSLMGVIDS